MKDWRVAVSCVVEEYQKMSDKIIIDKKENTKPQNPFHRVFVQDIELYRELE
jgi:hypothetical protein